MKVQILYPSHKNFDMRKYALLSCGIYLPKKEDVEKYVLVDEFEEIEGVPLENMEEYLSSIFRKYNSKMNLLSNPEKQTLISVGCIIRVDNINWLCDGIGWKKLVL